MSLSNKFDSNIYVEPDGSSWVRVFHHNNPQTYGVFVHHSDSEWNAGIYGTENKWFDLGILNDISGIWELMVKQATTSGGTEQKWRWTQAYNPLTTTAWATAQPGTVTFNTSTGYSTSSWGGLWKMNSSSRMNIANSSSGNWFGAIGSWTVYQNGFPGYPNTTITTGYLDLYVRVDSLLDSTTNLGPTIWLPLNGNLQNQGLSDVGVYNSGATINNEGKIGSCYEFNGSSNFLETSFKIDSTNYSFCCWAYLSPVAGYHLMDCRTADGNTGDQPMFVSASGIQAGNTGTNWYTFPYSFASNTWYHIAIVYSATDVKAYINGGLIGTTTTCKGYNFNQRFPLRVGTRCSGQNWFKGKVNDVRAYNYSLSAKEVREISKALVLHYKLDDPGIGKDNLLSSYDTSFLSFALGPITLFNSQMAGGTQEIVSGIGGATKCLHLHSNGGNNRQYGTLNCYAGNSYTVSCDYYSSVAQNTLPPFRGEMNGGDYSWQGSNAPAYTTPNQWVRLSFSYATLTSNATLYYFMQCAQGTDCYIKNIKIEKGTTSTPWVPAGQGGRLVVYDSSGFGYNGYLQSGRNIDVIADSSRYSASTRFPFYVSETGNYITMDNANFFSPLTACTVTWWGKYNATKSLLLTGQSTSYFLAAGNPSFYNQNANITKWYTDGVASGTPSYVANQWHFYAFTGRMNTWTKLMLNNYGGENTWSINGQISDFRIYNSTLSDADILELYQTSASIDRDGNYYTRELIEQ